MSAKHFSETSQYTMRPAFSLVELLIVITVIAMLVGLTLPAIGLVKTRVKTADARQLVTELTIAMEAYRADDRIRRYPLEEDCSACRGGTGPHDGTDLTIKTLRQGQENGTDRALEALISRNLLTLRGASLLNGTLVDPWGRPFRYMLSRPTPAAGAATDWNWDTTAGKVRAWDDRRNRAGAFPYIWSYGPKGDQAPITEWIYVRP